MQITLMSRPGLPAGPAFGRASPAAALSAGRLRRLGRVAVFACAAVVILAAAGEVIRRTAALVRVSPPAPAAPPPADAWLDIKGPIQLFALSGSAFGRLPLDYRARRRALGGERQDLLTFGRFAPGAGFLSLSLRRHPPPAEGARPPGDLFVSLARLAAGDGLSVERSALPTLLPTRFGPFAVADVTLASAAGGQACLGFALADGAAGPLDVAGLICRPEGGPMDRAALGCVLDRLDLVSAGEDDALKAFFVEAERRRAEGCHPPGGRELDGEALAPGLRRLKGHRTR